MSPSQPPIWEGRLEYRRPLQYLPYAFGFAEVLLEQPVLCDWYQGLMKAEPSRSLKRYQSCQLSPDADFC